MATETTKGLQHALNAFTNRYLNGVTPLIEDGVDGQLTRKRVRQAKYWLGYQGATNDTDSKQLRERLWHPKSARYSTPARIRRGMTRRSKSRVASRRNTRALAGKPGLTTMDGKTVPRWIAAQLHWAREIGHNGRKWNGAVISGTRTPVFSESLCFAMCGKPSCSGRCAGRSSNHNSDGTPGTGAVDVSDYVRLDELLPHCPESITQGHRLRNSLPLDKPHFSESGR